MEPLEKNSIGKPEMLYEISKRFWRSMRGRGIQVREVKATTGPWFQRRALLAIYSLGIVSSSIFLSLLN